MKFHGFLIIASVALAGCSTGPGIAQRKLSLPADWKQAGGFPVASAGKDLTRWWRQFQDPTLSRIIADALKNSPDVAVASARIREARARRNSEAASLLPSLNGSTGASSTASKRDGFDSSETNFTAGLNASWEADLFGKRRSSLEAAAAQVGASEENFHSVQAALASEIAIAYTQLRVDEAALDVLRRTVKTRGETSRLAGWRTQSGEADALESSQALSSLEQARAGIPALEQSTAQARNALSLLAGRTPGSLDGQLAAGRKSIPNPPRSLAVGIPADTLRQRPDVRTAGYQLLAAAATSRAVSAERFPTLNLNGSLGLNALSSGKLFDPQAASAGIIAGLTGPIFDAGRIHAAIDAQNAVEEQAYQNYRATVLTALSEVEDALIACRRTGERLEILEKAAAAAREASNLAQQRYEAGVTDILTVLETQRTLLGLEDSLFNIRASRAIAYIQLYKALGGGWS